MSDKQIRRAQKLIEPMGKHGTMYASTKEAFLAEIAGILLMAVDDFSVIEFYKSHIKVDGPVLSGLHDQVNNEWAEIVVRDALSHLKLNNL